MADNKRKKRKRTDDDGGVFDYSDLVKNAESEAEARGARDLDTVIENLAGDNVAATRAEETAGRPPEKDDLDMSGIFAEIDAQSRELEFEPEDEAGSSVTDSKSEEEEKPLFDKSIVVDEAEYGGDYASMLSAFGGRDESEAAPDLGIMEIDEGDTAPDLAIEEPAAGSDAEPQSPDTIELTLEAGSDVEEPEEARTGETAPAEDADDMPVYAAAEADSPDEDLIAALGDDTDVDTMIAVENAGLSETGEESFVMDFNILGDKPDTGELDHITRELPQLTVDEEAIPEITADSAPETSPEQEPEPAAAFASGDDAGEEGFSLDALFSGGVEEETVPAAPAAQKTPAPEPAEAEGGKDFLGLENTGGSKGSLKESVAASQVVYPGVEMDFDEQISAVTLAEVYLAQGKRDKAVELYRTVAKNRGVTAWVAQRLRELDIPIAANPPAGKGT